MCGIIACVGVDDAVNTLVTGLENLEYRGYDSAGIAIQNGTGVTVEKRAGEISKLKNTLIANAPDGMVGIGHTRWSTHGPPTDENAHPHTSETGRVAAVHNGIITNYTELREELEQKGYTFTSDTDTEVVPHLVEYYLEDGLEPRDAFTTAIQELEGSYAIALLVDGQDAIYAARQGSPLVVGLSENGFYLASDVPAFLDFTDRVMYLEDGDVSIVTSEGIETTTLDGTPVTRAVETVDWDPEETGKGGYEHYMLKEIETQPEALSQTLEGRFDVDTATVDLPEFPPGSFADVDDVHFVACGTSYHAGLYGMRLLNEVGARAQAFRASEYPGVPRSGETLVVAVTQSGETADTLCALRRAKEAGARTIAVTNVTGSTASREADDALYIRAGPEIGVAATKTFSSQVITLALFTDRVASDLEMGRSTEERRRFLTALSELPNQVEELVRTSRAQFLSEKYLDKEAYFFIGSGLHHPVALEGALKFKEITYEHAEGFASGELKHGPLALVTSETPVFALLDGPEDEKTRTNATEARSRGAEVIAVTSKGRDVGAFADDQLLIPSTHPDLSGVLANVQLQLVSYHTANLLGRSIDKPRNLAKSVTVE